jgi:CRP/FNR family transcriptional regulator, dissimilatory nitrate respiration regulator
MIDPALLEDLSPFRHTTRRVLSALAPLGTEVRASADTVLFLAGSEPHGWYVVIEGQVRVVRGGAEGDARQHVIHTESAGGTLGEVPVFAGGTHPATAITTEPTRLALFDLEALRAAIAKEPDVAFLLLERLALRVRSLVDRLDDRSARSVSARLAEYLLARHRAAATGRSATIGMTQQRLAEELGTVREVVSRELRRLERDGAIESLGGGRFRVPDETALRGRAG